MLCLVIAHADYEECKKRILTAQADLIEWRLDYLKELDFDRIESICAKSSIPFILTLRGEEIPIASAYVDVDWQGKIPGGRKVILSYHDWSDEPIDLEGVARKMEKVDAEYYKIAKKTSSTEESLRLLLERRKLGEKFIVLPMQEGDVRMLCPVVGNPIDYCAYSEEERTAPGQVVVGDWAQCTPKTKIFALIGNPVEQSPSRDTHNARFYKDGVDAVYVRLCIENLEEFFELAREFPIWGMSVTIPYKEKVQPFLAHVDEEAEAIGAVNTLVLMEGGYIGYNTDGKGALDVIERRFRVKGKRIVLIGAGGSARAIAYEARMRGADVRIHARNKEKAKMLGYPLAEGLECDLLINCTPEPMPVPIEQISSMYMDLSPRGRNFEGIECISGHEMFLKQAEYQFELFYNIL